jgi:GNAT superfamily N-acetyltransferase
MEIRQATLSDRPRFLSLWKDFIIEQAKLGSPLEVCDDNLRTYLGLFESYITGSLFGFTLLATKADETVGVLMIGETPPNGLHFITRDGTVATLWGVYVQPEHRRKGICWALQDAGRPITLQLGFNTMRSTILADDPASNANALNWGAKISQHLISFPVADSEHGKQKSTQ